MTGWCTADMTEKITGRFNAAGDGIRVISDMTQKESREMR